MSYLLTFKREKAPADNCKAHRMQAANSELHTCSRKQVDGDVVEHVIWVLLELEE